jgi:transposase
MRQVRHFSVAFKRQVVEELLAKVSTLGQLSRRHEISPSVIAYWRTRYGEGKLIDGPSATEKALEARVADLERMVGRLAMENELLKKAASYMAQRRKETSSVITGKTLAPFNGGAK